jgi:dGTPase
MPPINNLLCQSRLNSSTYGRPCRLEEFHSDHSRILFSTSFRHLVQKAQVFPLEANTAVRNRLTHTLEVADIGRTLTRKVAERLRILGLADEEQGLCMEAIVSNACLLHDIGNPPFGHFGESAIKRWFLAKQTTPSISPKPLLRDLMHFDGNPQGFRVVTTLHNERDTYGLNLTAATLLASVKYPRNIGRAFDHAEGTGRPKPGKLGVFSTEENIWRAACTLACHDPNKRFLLAYLMEAADDICYCTSDISDALEKRIISVEQLRDYVVHEMGGREAPSAISGITSKTHFGIEVAVRLSRLAMDQVADYFVHNIDRLAACGDHESLMSHTAISPAYNCLRRFAKEHIYNARNVQRIEVAGFHVITGLLERFDSLTDVDRVTWRSYMEDNQRPQKDCHDLEWRVFCQLGDRVKNAYLAAVTLWPALDAVDEQLLRYRMIVDYIAGQTDQYALALHQLFTGVSL